MPTLSLTLIGTFFVSIALQVTALSLLPITQGFSRPLPTIRLETLGMAFTTSAQLLTDVAQVGEVAQKFRGKYGAGQVKAYYPKLDVAVEVLLA